MCPQKYSTGRFTPASKTTSTHSVKGCMGSTAGVGVLEKRQIPCPSRNELQPANRGLVTTDNASPVLKHFLCLTFFPVG